MNIDICVCTYRRPHVADTLKSLAQLTLRPDWQVRIIVADNDETPGARETVEAAERLHGLSVTYLHAPARNISVARNACLDAATAPLVAFIDDDEAASPGWLGALIDEMERSKADVVLGPVQAAYPESAPGWMREGDFHSTKPVWVDGEIITGYTGNVLLRREAPALHALRFRKELGRTGGEDTLFFATAHRAGAKIAFAPDAIVTEAVPLQRASLLWLIKTSFRGGQTHGLLLLERDGTTFGPRARNAALAFAKALFCSAVAIPSFVKPSRAAFWFLRGVMHVGVAARLSGKSELVQYG